MLRIHAEPALRSPVLLCGFSGWSDAASSASSALRYLLLKRQGRKVAEFDPDAIYAYTITRPVTTLNADGTRSVQWPSLAWTAVEVPEASRDLLILLGPEPDLRWRECLDAVVSFASRLGVSQVLALGALLAQVHYAGPPTMIGSSSDPTLRAQMRQLGLGESNYQGPSGFITSVVREAASRGIPSASIWVAAPNYLSNTSNPKLAAALLRTAERLLGQDLWREELEAAGRDMERRIEEALRERPELVTFLEKLGDESSPQSTAPDETEEPESELPSAEEVLMDLEEHLRRVREDRDQDGGDG